MANNTTTFTAKFEADTKEAEKNVEDFTGAVENSIAGLKTLKKQLKETAAGSADFNRISAQIRDVEDALEGAKLQADDFAGALEGAPGIVGQLAGGFKKVEIATKSWGAALRATGVGLIVSLTFVFTSDVTIFLPSFEPPPITSGFLGGVFSGGCCAVIFLIITRLQAIAGIE